MTTTEENIMTTTDRIDLGLTGAAGCSCCADSSPSTPVEATPGEHQTKILVEGMTCSHCVASVTQELSALDGVKHVGVELTPNGASTVTIMSTTVLDADRVRAGVEEAGYSLASSEGQKLGE